MTNLVQAFEDHRALLFGIAYRMTGSAMDAEDLVQEAYLRWARTPQETVRSPREYLVTTITHLALDYANSARVRREQYVGPWLPEPLVGTQLPDVSDAPDARVEFAESLQFAFLVLLEKLTPDERAAFLLRNVFDYEYAEIARMLGTSQANCRQLVSRARDRVLTGRPRFEPTQKQVEAMLASFLEACATGNLDALLQLLAPDVNAVGDGGGKALNVRQPVYGASNVARLFLGLATRMAVDIQWAIERVNGHPGLVFRIGTQLDAVMTIAVRDQMIQAVYIVNNPDKLRPHHVAGRISLDPTRPC